MGEQQQKKKIEKNQETPQHRFKKKTLKSLKCSKSSSKREVYSYTELPKETRKITSSLTYHIKELEKEE